MSDTTQIPRIIADYFLVLSEPEVGDSLTNLKIQKLVYYAQGYHLALFDKKPFFDEEILHWEHGPVVRSLYDQLKEYGSNPVPIPARFECSDYFTQEQCELLSEIHDVYGQFSAWKLRNLTHSERPWAETAANQPIPKELMYEFFKEQLIQP